MEEDDDRTSTLIREQIWRLRLSLYDKLAATAVFGLGAVYVTSRVSVRNANPTVVQLLLPFFV